MPTRSSERWKAIAALVAPPLLFAAHSRAEGSLLRTGNGWLLLAGTAVGFIACFWLCTAYLLRIMSTLNVWPLLVTAAAIATGPFWPWWLGLPMRPHSPFALVWFAYFVFASSAAIVPVGSAALKAIARQRSRIRSRRADEEL